MRALSLEARAAGKSVEFVPTMGALHQGHLSLMRRARRDGGLLAVSIFVNPTQFGPGEDFESYPRRPEEDAELCADEGVDVIFAPGVEEMYPAGRGLTFVEPGPISQKLEGMTRPAHFRGVCTVVAKLLNIALPDRAYFGQKDAQQAAVIRQMIADLSFGVEIVVCPTVREADGLAMSSRNAYLKPKERQAALSLPRALTAASKMVELGETKGTEVAAAMAEEIVVEPLCELDYAAVVDLETFDDVNEIARPVLAALAVRVGEARLIDNVILEPGGRGASGRRAKGKSGKKK
jgi:pantoate--beta-alanine ligase